MRKQFLLPFLLLSVLVSSALAGRSHHHHHHHHHHDDGRQYSQKKLFVFGDSYVDTGNWNKVAGISWKPPYGLIFPGKPAGRFSDGRVLTDFVAQYFHIRSPIPYVRRNMLPNAKTQFGMNFAYGGTGVFNTYVPLPNMTVQINFFKDVITREKVYTAAGLQSSIALVSLAGNDYATLRMHEQRNPEELKRFIKFVVHQLVLNVKQIHSLGVAKIVVTTLPPLGCLPITTFLFGYKNCLSRLNEASVFHNQLLKEGLNMLNKEIPKPAFFILDLYDAFLLALQGHRIPPRKLEYRNPLIQCCQGITSGHDCGSIEGNEAKYKVCNHPQKAFFWDTVHLTEHGWHQVYLAVQPTLRKLL